MRVNAGGLGNYGHNIAQTDSNSQGITHEGQPLCHPTTTTSFFTQCPSVEVPLLHSAERLRGAGFQCELSAAHPGLQELLTHSVCGYQLRHSPGHLLLSRGPLWDFLISADKRFLWLRTVRTGCPSRSKGFDDSFVELCTQRSTARMISSCWIKPVNLGSIACSSKAVLALSCALQHKALTLTPAEAPHPIPQSRSSCSS